MHRTVMGGAAAAAVLSVAAATGCSTGSDTPRFTLLANSALGDDAVVETPVPDWIAAATPDAQAAARSHAKGAYIAPPEDADRAVAAVADHITGSELAAAVAEALGLSGDDPDGYLTHLTPALLGNDAAVTEYRRGGDGLEPRPIVMQAGTPVLVDAYGMPRLRVQSGTPLAPITERGAAPEATGDDAWEAYDASRVSEPEPAGAPLSDLPAVDAQGRHTSLDPGMELCNLPGGPMGKYCSVVAYADLDGDGGPDPIAAGLTGSPSVRLITFDDAGRPTASSSTLDPESGTGLGPSYTGTPMENVADRIPYLLYGAYDILGDDLPELVLWSGSTGKPGFIADTDSGGHNNFMVFTRQDDGTYTPVPSPSQGMFSRGDMWGSPIGYGEYSYRCTDSGGFASVSKSGDRQKVTYLTWDGRAWSWGPSVFEPFEPAADPALPATFDCDDQAERVADVAPAEAGVDAAPGTSTDCTVNVDGENVYIRTTAGRVACGDVQSMLEEYRRLAPVEGGGNAQHVTHDGWHCSTYTAGEHQRTGLDGLCESVDGSWSLERSHQPIVK